MPNNHQYWAVCTYYGLIGFTYAETEETACELAQIMFIIIDMPTCGYCLIGVGPRLFNRNVEMGNT